MSNLPNLHTPTRAQLRALVLLECALLAPLAMTLPWLLLPVLAVVGAYRLSCGRDYQPPRLPVLALITVASLILMILISAPYNLIETMFGVLGLSFILKLLEVRSLRDTSTLMLLGFILIAANLMFHPSLLASLYAIACTVFLLALWRQLGSPSTNLERDQQAPTDNHLRWSLLLLIKALPIFLFLFLLMPRVDPLWNLPNPSQAQTGFSDSLDLAGIAALAQDTSTAFRVNFEGPRPAYDQLYWVGTYLSHYDGRKWYPQLQPGELQKPQPPQALAQFVENPNRTTDYRYSILLEPHGQTALFRLEHLLGASSGQTRLLLNSEGNLALSQPLSQRINYSVHASLRANPTPVSPDNYLQLPPEGNPKTRALAASFVQQRLSPQEIIEQALALYREDFRYSLAPPALGSEQIDDFMFATRVGFCGHFASSLTFLLRAAQIPARIASGYMGGTYNPTENYLRVQQSDAHAWVEVWLARQGWVRIDPTAVVAPERFSSAPDARAAGQEYLPRSSRFSQGSFLHQLELQWDAIDYAWQRFVTEFDGDRYLNRLSVWLGLYKELVSGALIVVGVALATLVSLLSLAGARGRASRDPASLAERRLTTLLHKLRKHHLTPTPAQSPAQFLEDLAQRNPTQAHTLRLINECSTALLYAERQPANAYLRQLRRALGQLRLRSLK